MNLFLPIFLFPLCTAYSQLFGNGEVNANVVDVSSIEGVWELTNMYWVKDGDTLLLGPDEIPVKHKIYLDGYVI